MEANRAALAPAHIFAVNSVTVLESSRPAVTEPTSAEIRAELDRILSSRCFAHAGRASDFLRFVVEETLAGTGHRLKGYTIGIEVFARPPDFDPQADPLVRVEAGRLRSRLAEYYQGEGASDAVRIDLPRGGYAVTWRRVETVVAPTPAAAASAAPPLSAGVTVTPWRAAAASLAVLFVVTFALLVWQSRELGARAPSAEASERVATAEPPRIFVTAFRNYTPDHRELDPLAASLREELMLELGRYDVRVVAPEPGWLQSAAAGAAAHDYVLSGSVRHSGERVRIAVRLTERDTGVQLWNHAYDQLHEIVWLPELQAALAHEVAAVALPYGPIFDAELARNRVGGEPVLRDCLARYLDYRRTMDVVPFRTALECYQGLSLREPAVGAVWAGLAMVYLDDYGFRYGNTAGLEASLMLAREAVERALALDRGLLLANLALARLQFFDGRHTAFGETVARVLALEPDNAEARAYLGTILTIAGDPRGLALVDEARKLSPNQPGMVNMAYVVDHLRHGRADEALEAAQRVGTPNWFPAQMIVAAAAGLCGDERLAERARVRLLQLYPTFEAEALEIFVQWHHDPALNAALVAGLTRAGLHLAGSESGVKQWPESWL